MTAFALEFLYGNVLQVIGWDINNKNILGGLNGRRDGPQL
jgi:hypothetical protein